MTRTLSPQSFVSLSPSALLRLHHHLFLPLRSLKTLTPPTSSTSTSPKSDRDAYFVAIHHISLKTQIPVESFRFFSWARSHLSYSPTTLEFEQLLLTLSRHWEPMWKVAHQMKTLGLPISSNTFSVLIESYGQHGLADRAAEAFNRMRHFDCPQTAPVYNSLLSALSTP